MLIPHNRTMRILASGCVLLFLGLPAISNSAENITPAVESPTIESLPAPLLQISETEAFSKFVILVDKEKRRLTVFERNGAQIKKVEEYPADIGKNGGNKVKRDDARTPEGIYFLQKRLAQPEIPFDMYGALAFTTDYPNLFDRRENKTGSGIWLHAIPDTVALTRGSKGCVVVRNDVIKKLADYIKLNETPILIFDHVNYLTKTEHEKSRIALNDFIEGWRQAWETQDISKYITYYDQDFKAPGFNLKTWEAHKTSLKSKYEFIKVNLSQPYIIQHKDQLLVKTLQRYESNKYIDYGVKTIYAIKTGSSYKIIREEWSPFSEKEVTKAIARENPLTAQASEQTP